MNPRLSRRAFGAGAAAAVAAGLARTARAVEPIKLRVSIETAAMHGRNICVTDYVRKVEAASQGRIKGEVFGSAQLFSDLNVARALTQGQVEMAVPGTWSLTGFVPSGDLFQLPALYSQPIELTHRVVDGKAGEMVNAELRRKLRVHVLGPWLDLGFQNWYSAAKPLGSFADLRGMKLRNSGGAGQAWRTGFFGAIANTTAWSNVPLALAQGTFDGLITTHETMASASMWESGVKYSLEDNQTLAVYVPVVSEAFWTKLTPDLQAIMTDLWSANVSAYRTSMAAAQQRARDALVEHGIRIVVPEPQEIAATRAKMLVEQDRLIAEWRITPQIARQVMTDIGAA